MPADFAARIAGGTYAALDIRKLWPDTRVNAVFLHRDCVRDMHQLVQTENIDLIRPGYEDQVPEVGGFFLGYYTPYSETAAFAVALEQFIPIRSRERLRSKLEFNTENLVDALGDAQDNFPELAVIGWFHTHPGHGLYLSKQDFTIHLGFFYDDFQIAMEMDTLTRNLDTGVFTKNAQGEVNNSDISAPHWYSWHDILQSVGL